MTIESVYEFVFNQASQLWGKVVFCGSSWAQTPPVFHL